jgi:Ca2+-transporting ATPase
MSAVSLAAQSIAIRYHMHWQTIVFNVLCLSQMGHVLAIRSSRSSFAAGTFSNWPLLASVLLTCLLQAGITFIPSLHFVFKTQSLDIGELALVSIASAIVFLTLECQKWLSPYFSAPAGIASKGTLV